MKILIEPRGADCFILRMESPHTLTNANDVEVFYAALFDLLDKHLKGRKAYFLLDLSNFIVSTTAAKHYGEWSKKFSATYSLGTVRFGVKDGMTKAAVLTQSIINRYSANVYQDLAAAEAVVRQLRSGSEKSAKAK